MVTMTVQRQALGPSIDMLKARQQINLESVSTQYTQDHLNKYQENKFC